MNLNHYFYIPILVYSIVDFSIGIYDPNYLIIGSILFHLIMILLTFILGQLLLIFIEQENRHERLMKAFKLALFWNYSLLIFTDGYILLITFREKLL